MPEEKKAATDVEVRAVDSHVHGPHCSHGHGPQEPRIRAHAKLGRNDPCHCGSGKKYKKCHEPIDMLYR
ncbi:MAG TPA: SEC-C metal-binding domain-containing protein [Myxococcota bacterium]|nr:SEC-C metal-binding domain-containing protein [Myxococcota bacterium]